MPMLGFGVGTAWMKYPGDRRPAVVAAVTAALDAGFRHIDDAEVYGNEEFTAEAIHGWLDRTGASRSDLFVTQKVLGSAAVPGPVAHCSASLKKTRLEYYDLYLIHAPCHIKGERFSRPLIEIWREMETLVSTGKVRAIGVSNWRVCDLEEIWEQASVKPVCNQIEAHPFLQQPRLLRWCQEHDVVVSAYSPLTPITRPEIQGAAQVGDVVSRAAERTGRSPMQVLLRWSLQTGRLPITTSSKPERMAEALQIFQEDFELTQEEVGAISAAGAASPRRIFWVNCPQFFSEDPRQEAAADN